MQLVTQISGKYSNDDTGLFDLKIHLEKIGIKVNFPENSKIVAYRGGIPLTFIPTPERNFYDIEIEFFESIRVCEFHIVHNNYKDLLGYIGYSTSHEICFAMKENKKIVFQFSNLLFSDSVPDDLKNIIMQKRNNFVFCTSDILKETISYFTRFAGHCEYGLNKSEIEIINSRVLKLLASYKD